MINRLKQGHLKCYFFWLNYKYKLVFRTISNTYPVRSIINNALITFLDHIPKDVKVEDEVSSLRSRLRQTFQEKVLVIKDKY